MFKFENCYATIQTNQKMTTEQQSNDYNLLIQKWLMQWREQARSHGSKLEYVYGKALKTLREHSNPIKCKDDFRKLKNFGPKICQKIETELAKMNVSSGPAQQQTSPQRSITDILAVRSKRPLIATPKQANVRLQRITSNSPAVKVAKTQRNWVPTPGQIPYAILIALLRRHLEFDDSHVNRLDLQDLVELYTATRPLVLTCALNSLIVKRRLVNKTCDRNARYFLTESGKKLAIQLAKQSLILKDFCDRFINNQLHSNQCLTIEKETESIAPASSNFILQSGHYDIILCIDTRERYSDRQGTQNRTAFAVALQQKGIMFEIRTLPLGDFVWIAREKQCSEQQQIRRELVLDFIIERKRIDDLASSIKSNRWNEQKFRLSNSGIRNPMYLIEYMGKKSRKQDHGYLPAATLEQAMTNCEMDGFQVHITDNFDETVRFLVNMTKYLIKFYADKSLISCHSVKLMEKTCANDLVYLTFNEFATNSTKISIFTAQEMFIKHLLQMRGCSMKKIEAFIKHFPTIQSLLEAYTNTQNGDKLLVNMMGPALSRKMYHFYYSNN